MSSKTNVDKMASYGIPIACRNENLYSNDKELENETTDWLKERGGVVLWSRLKFTNCIGQQRGDLKATREGNYDVEIPGRLLSLFGTINDQTVYTNSMKDMKGYQLLSCVFALCSILKENFREWSEDVLNHITSEATVQYQELLQKLAITNKELTIRHLNQSYIFNGLEFKTQLQQVATGFVYIRYGFDEFNLARVLPWFFRQYQFGLIQCAGRTLAIGQTLDTDYAFFMYDCQSSGYPLFEEHQASSYILRTNHMQILLYCITVTLNVTAQTAFVLYNADIVMTYPLEKNLLKKEEYVPIIGQLSNRTSGKVLLTTASDNKPATKNIPANKNSSPVCKSQPFKKPQTSKKILLDPDKMYYIIAVPRNSTSISAKLETKQLLFSNNINSQEGDLANVQVSIHRLGPPADSLGIQEGQTETVNFITSKEAADMAQANVLRNPNNLGFKVYLVDESGNSAPSKSNMKNKIKIAHQLRDFFTK